MRLAALFLIALSGCQPDAQMVARDSVSRAAAFLWQHQGADGGWHSDTYGILDSGQSLTPLILLTLMELPDDIPIPHGGVERAVEFICANVNSKGALGLSDEVVADYPNYATALAVQALRRAGKSEESEEVAERMLTYLRGQQFSEELGWKPDDKPYGGWGMGGEPRVAPNHGHLDLSMSRIVMEAFAGADSGDPLVQRALSFLKRCQNRDGGFLFSPAIAGINKSREGNTLYSYGSTTADGILALLAMGVDAEDQRVRKAAAWLIEHHRVDLVPGFTVEQRGTWDRGLRFYYLAASSRAFAALGVTQGREELVSALTREQSSDGSWTNPNRLVKEDDPLIATALALRSLRYTY